MPGLTRAAVLTNPAPPYTAPVLKESTGVARALGVQLQLVEARDPSEFEAAFATMANKHAGALTVLTDVTFITHRKRIVELAAMSRIPAVYRRTRVRGCWRLDVYGASLADMYRRAAVYVDKILKGAKPGDLPIEQPTKFELVINLKAAKALGLAIPQSLLLRADEVIQ